MPLEQWLTIHLKIVFIRKKINVLTIFYKSDVKTFLKWIVNHYFKGTH